MVMQESMNTSAEAKPGSTSLLGVAAKHHVMCQPLRRKNFAAVVLVEVRFADVCVSGHLGNTLSVVG